MVCALRYAEKWDSLIQIKTKQLQYQDENGTWHDVPTINHREAYGPQKSECGAI